MSSIISTPSSTKPLTTLIQCDPLLSNVTLLSPYTAKKLILSAIGFTLEFTRGMIESPDEFAVHALNDGIRCTGAIPGTDLLFEVFWTSSGEGVFRKRVIVLGHPCGKLGSFKRLHVVANEVTGAFDDTLGWREVPLSVTEVRPPEEGAGFLSPFGYPVFGEDFFAGLEHPMGAARHEEGSLHLFHHPQWTNGLLESVPAVFGFPQADETVAQAFNRYIEKIRLPRPERAMVEVNSFWTDRYSPCVGYATDAGSYSRFIIEWTKGVLEGRRELLSSIMFDAGWQQTKSLFRPATAVGGPGDAVLAELGHLMEECGIEMGLWWSFNGPMGVDAKYAEEQGFRISDQGSGSGYGQSYGRRHYMCLTDSAWEKAIGDRLEEILDHTPVTFLKTDWDNDGVQDPTLYPEILSIPEQMQEANVNVMIRLLKRITTYKREVRVRAGWWCSPWWALHAHNTHLPNSGDSEAADIPSLCQREALITSRDTLLYHLMVTCRTPIPWDFISPHEFASAPQNPVQDTDESWLNNLIVWIARGTHYLQICMPPYDLRGWRAWALKEVLAWFRSHEDLMWKGTMCMVGGNPGVGEVYGFLHEADGRTLLVLRNPMAFPQAVPSFSRLGLCDGAWHQIFPVWEEWDSATEWLPSNATVMLVQGDKKWERRDTLLRSKQGALVPWSKRSGEFAEIPLLHTLPKSSVTREVVNDREWVFHAVVPYGLDGAEWVLRFDLGDGGTENIRAGMGRYPDGYSTAPMAITFLRSHWRVGHGQARMGMTPYDQDLAVARIECAVGGMMHLYLKSDRPLPKLLEMWIEGREALVAEGAHSTRQREINHVINLIPPSTLSHRKVIAALN